MNLDLKGKKALVCGSTQGIGKATAIELANLGAEVTLCARNEEKLKAVVGGLSITDDQNHQYLVADFENPENVAEVFDQYTARNGGVHILINNTGGPPAGQLIEASLETLNHALSMHLQASHLLVQKALPYMKQQGYGRIINIISTSVKIPIPGLGVSNTTRGAMASWAKTLSIELGEFKITVNNVLPGLTETERLYQIIKRKSEISGQSEKEIADAMKREIPAKRFATPSEVGLVAAFLASPAAAYINGTSIPVDGGKTGCI